MSTEDDKLTQISLPNKLGLAIYTVNTSWRGNRLTRARLGWLRQILHRFLGHGVGLEQVAAKQFKIQCHCGVWLKAKMVSGWPFPPWVTLEEGQTLVMVSHGNVCSTMPGGASLMAAIRQ